MTNNTSAGRSTKNDFGGKGWLMIVISGLCYFFFAGMINDGLNIIVANFSAEHGVDYNACLASATPAAWFGIIGVAFWTVVVQKIGSRKVGAISLVLGAVSYALYGVVSTVTGFFVVTALVNFMAYGFCNTAAQVMIAHWFPTRKGLALGWATMGSNLGSALCVYLLRFVFGKFNGTAGGFTVIGIVVIIFAVVCFFIYRDAPEQMGLTPDNLPMTPEEIKASREKFEQTEPVRVGWLLRQRNFWVDAVLFGLLGMACAGLVSQFVVGLTQVGIEEDRAVFLFAISAIVAMAMSYLFGWLDVKIGTKMATFWLGLCFAVGALCLVLIPYMYALVYPSLLLIAGGIGGYVNLMPSMCSSIFGRKLFVQAYGAATIITGCIRATVFSVMAWSLTQFGDYMMAYKILIAVSLIGSFMVFLLKEDDFAINKGEAV